VLVGPGASNAGIHPLADHGALELANTPIIWNMAFTGWRRCVDALLM